MRKKPEKKWKKENNQQWRDRKNNKKKNEWKKGKKKRNEWLKTLRSLDFRWEKNDVLHLRSDYAIIQYPKKRSSSN